MNNIRKLEKEDLEGMSVTELTKLYIQYDQLSRKMKDLSLKLEILEKHGQNK